MPQEIVKKNHSMGISEVGKSRGCVRKPRQHIRTQRIAIKAGFVKGNSRGFEKLAKKSKERPEIYFFAWLENTNKQNTPASIKTPRIYLIDK